VAAAEELAARLRLELAAPFLVQDSEFYLAASVGIAVGGTHTAAAELLRDADAAMYRAKDRGRARQEVFDTGMRAEAVARLDTEAALRRALGHGQLCLEFQPVVDLASGRIGAMEALVRWRHPTRGLVPPGDFIPLAEESGLILPLGAEVLEMACRQAAAWAAGPGAPLKVAVNLSPRQLADPDLVPMVASHLRASKLDPSLLCLEITESSLMETVENPREILDQLRTLGVTLVIDDFGTGYSSLSRLRRFPVATLKIDRSFVAELGCDPKGLDVVAAMVNLGHALDMEVVAEGIETQAQLQHLRELGCDGGQGFFLARPAPAEAVTTLLSGPPFRVGLTP
jgi:EAL domain-containing protein (putative c-di-GMP-specific phosphodiesterase class I)